jgi:Rrf2 family transcriptional regulator, cysteine metabolism repressor
MQVSQKCQYTLRAMFELAKRFGRGPTIAAEIAEAQAIPSRFLEIILQGLKNSGEIESRRGINGGYVLSNSPETITVGQIIRYVDGTLSPVACIGSVNEKNCQLKGKCAFVSIWQRAQQAVSEVYDSTTLQDLIDNEQTAALDCTPLEYVI